MERAVRHYEVFGNKRILTGSEKSREVFVGTRWLRTFEPLDQFLLESFWIHSTLLKKKRDTSGSESNWPGRARA